MKMNSKKKFLVEKKTLTSLTYWMNEQYKKQTNKPFTTGDVQKYIGRGAIPEYLGGNTIVADSSISGVKLYNVIE